MKIEETLRQALDIPAPWQIVRLRNDLGKNQIDLWIAQEVRSGWFLGARAERQPANEKVWRHINLGNARCYLHVTPPTGENHRQLQWLGDDDQPFSRALGRQIVGMLREGVAFQAICVLLDIPVTELWKFKHSLDNGTSGFLAPTSPDMPAAPGASMTPPALPVSAVPEVHAPVWEKLLDGSANLDIRALSLKLLLTKLREHYSSIMDSEVRSLKVHELRRYFVRHEKLLGHELAQLNRF